MPDKTTQSAPRFQVRAYLHPTADHCVSVDPVAYSGPRQLVAMEDVISCISKLEAEMAELKACATDAALELARALAEIKRLKGARERPGRSKEIPDGFAEFWDAWPAGPRKVNKKACLARWNAANLEPLTQQIVEHVQASKVGRDWQKDGGAYIPAPLVYLNQGRYLAPPAAPVRAVGSISGMNYKPTGVDSDGHFN